jgi:pilus assembly protein FimV
MQKVKGIKLACLAAFAILPIQAYALGVGKLTMHSALDEPLDATIELTAATPSELETLEVTLGSAGVFQMAGIQRNEQLKAIQFNISKENGKDVIKLSTELPYRDPFLHIIVNASWSSGSMLREYTALLDPPSYVSGAPAAIEMPVSIPAAAEPGRVATQKPSTPSSLAAAPISPADVGDTRLGPSGIAETGTVVADMRPGGSYGPIKRGDVLWSIAEDVKSGTNLDVAQIMMAIYRSNPDAFMRNNVNLMKVGKTLDIPSDSEISSIARTEARAQLQAQIDDWQDYVAGVGSMRTAAETTPAAEQGTAGVERTAEKPATEKDVLKIVRAPVAGAEPTGTGDENTTMAEQVQRGQEISSYKERINVLEESLVSADLEKKELSARVALLEEQIDKANKLIDMQNADLARLQGEPIGATPSAPVAKVAEPTKQTVQTGQLAAPDISQPKQVSKPVPEKSATEPKKAAPEKPAPQKAAPAKTRVQPVQEKGFFDSLMGYITGSWLTMVGAAAILLLLLVGIFVVVRRKRSIAEFEDSIISGTAVLDISTAESSEPADSRSETSFLSDFVPGMGNMQADEVDPLAEAEVYMAYGRDEQAEEVLKEAAEKDPDRHELKLKLLEIYQGRKDVASFETMAEELYPADGKVPAEVWSKVVDMGKVVSPDNPLFQGDVQVKDETLFGDKKRKDDVAMSDLLKTDTEMAADEADLMDELDKEDITEEITEEMTDTEELTDEIAAFSEEITEELTEENKAADEDMVDMSGEFESISGEADEKKEEGFPEPDAEVLDMDLGDYKPDESQETDSFDLDSLGLNLDDLEGASDSDEKAGEKSGEMDLGDLDLDLEGEETASSDEKGMEMPGIEDINLDLDTELESHLEADTDTAESAVQDETLEFADLGDLTMDDKDSGAAESAEIEDISGEMPAGASETWDEAGTKLDLAKAYVEMDDKESAMSILEEVAKEGTEDQKKEAQDLINRLGLD